jgi:protein TonB
VFDNLVESNPKNRKVGGAISSSMTSLVVHGVLIYLAVIATMKGKEIVQQITQDTTLVFLTHEEKPEEPKEQPPQIATLNPPPKGFQTLSAPVDIPTEIPPVNLNERFDPRDYSGVGVEGGIAKGVVGGTGPVDLEQVFVEAVVDEPPIRLSGPALQYPPLLRDAGIEGQVVIEFVVGVDGHPEPDQLRIISSTNRAFEKYAKDAVLGSVYRPGRMRGQPVRVLVRQPVVFSIVRNR